MKKSHREQLNSQRIREELEGIMAMFATLGRCYSALPDKSGITEQFVQFDGFDANDDEESDFLDAARKSAATRNEREPFNSHMPRLRSYRGMVERWNQSKDRENLTSEDIIRITTFHSP